MINGISHQHVLSYNPKKSNLLSVNILTETKRHAGQKAAAVSQPIPPNIAPSIRTAAQAIT